MPPLIRVRVLLTLPSLKAKPAPVAMIRVMMIVAIVISRMMMIDQLSTLGNF